LAIRDQRFARGREEQPATGNQRIANCELRIANRESPIANRQEEVEKISHAQ
jgi:hypothetical protein